MSTFRKWAALALAAFAISFLYLYKLNGVGVIGPDEPRYAAIGRTMAQTGDFITPVLWGKPWFEKPPLLYWMTAFGTSIGLSADLCGRLPVALLSLLFLACLYLWTKREFGSTAAAVACVGLATSAGWITYSSLCLTDLPMAVTFSVALALCSSLLGPVPAEHTAIRFAGIGIFLGLAILAKGLVPIALAAPMVWYLRNYFRSWWIAITACTVVALPWYWLVYARNGFVFIEDFFIKHHLQRLYSASLLHTQPPYYYIPVLLAGLFPWTPLFFVLFLGRKNWDQRQQFLLVTAVIGFIFFSATRNKLPHYILPILPILFVLLGSWFEHRKFSSLSRGWWLAPALLLATIPLIADILPPILAAGRLTRASVGPLHFAQACMAALPLVMVFLIRKPWIGVVLAACTAVGFVYLKASSYPAIDALVSPRPFWIANRARLVSVCNGGANRDWLYGLSYYRGFDFPECQTGHFTYALRTVGRGAPEFLPLH